MNTIMCMYILYIGIDKLYSYITYIHNNHISLNIYNYNHNKIYTCAYNYI